MNSLAVPTCLARRQRNSGHVNWVVGKGKRTWGHWQHLLWCTPYTTEIHSLPMLSSLSLIIASSRWWLVKMSLKELLSWSSWDKLEYPLMQLFLSLQGIIIITSLYHLFHLPLTLDHRIWGFTLLAQWSHWDVHPWRIEPLTTIPLSECCYFCSLFVVITWGHQEMPWSQTYTSLLPLCSSNSQFLSVN